MLTAVCACAQLCMEQEHVLRFTNLMGQDCKLSIYAVDNDLAGLIPLMGICTCIPSGSDGRQDPAVVAAYMRRMGYDFIALTDHSNFSASIECMDAYRDAPIEMCLMTGEEVHLPDCHLHCVHVGGQYSINAMVDTVFSAMERKNPGITARFPHMWKKMEGSSFPGTMTEGNSAKYSKVRGHAGAHSAGFTPCLRRLCWICDQIRAAADCRFFRILIGFTTVLSMVLPFTPTSA